MGNNPTRVERAGSASSTQASQRPGQSESDRAANAIYVSRSGRSNRHDLSFLGISGNTTLTPAEYVEQRRETKAEREARRQEKERAARLAERERSMRDEHVDGGYLVTQGVYTGPEDFSRAIVRQLMIERRLAPFWRGLNDHSDTWTEYQLVCAARGLPIPPADEIPPEDFLKPPTASSASDHLAVPILSKTSSTDSNNLSPLSAAGSLPAATAPNSPNSPNFRPRSKTLASLSTTRSAQFDPTPREIMLPHDPYVNGQPLEVALYKEAPECIICMMSYPPYLNHTRCCAQPICSECFVQIKRPDPHPPEHEQPGATPAPQPEAEPESLVSEPAQCPYCQQAEFGVTYDPPPFRRGLVYALSHGPSMGSVASAMSSSSSLNSTGSQPTGGRRRTTSLSASAPSVITTDKIRPDWANKLANARNHAARRAAAATALHTAAYLMGGPATDSRRFSFSTRRRLAQSRGSESASGSNTPDPNNAPRDEPQNGGAANRRRTRIDDLEDMMLMEAIRLSLAAEEERKRKEDKEAKKKEKKKEKEAKKAEKSTKKGIYSTGSSASGSALSLSLPVIGRRRGNSASSVLTNVAESDPGKGKAVDRGLASATMSAVGPISIGPSSDGTPPAQSPIPVITAPDKPSHLRQISTISTSGASTDSGSAPQAGARESSSTLASHPELNTGGPAANQERERDGENGTESLFNFSSLAAVIGQDGDVEDNEDAARHIEYLGGGHGEPSAVQSAPDDAVAAADDTPGPEPSDSLQTSMATLKQLDFGEDTEPLLPKDTPPEVTVTPDTPGKGTGTDDDAKSLLMPAATPLNEIA